MLKMVVSNKDAPDPSPVRTSDSWQRWILVLSLPVEYNSVAVAYSSQDFIL
jgi:hypothetical protein